MINSRTPKLRPTARICGVSDGEATMNKVRFAVLGGGNGAFAFAGDLAIAGYSVNLYEDPRFAENIKGVQEAGGIEVTGFGPGIQGGFANGWPRTGFGELNRVTTDIKEALDGVDVILVVTPAFGHETMFNFALPYLTDKQTLVFNTANWACLRFAKTLEKAKKTTLAETAILVYSCRKSGPARVHIDGMKETLALATVPSDRTSTVLKIFNEAYSGITKFTAAKNVLETSLSNVNLVFHPGLTVLNAGLIEQKKRLPLLHIRLHTISRKGSRYRGQRTNGCRQGLRADFGEFSRITLQVLHSQRWKPLRCNSELQTLR